VTHSPRVTVIVATFDSSATLALALRSVLEQQERDFECWVIGDACTDDSESVVRGFGDARLQWANLPVNSGSQAGPNNEGIARARGRYIAFLGHDDLWLPWHLAGLLSEIERTGADWCHSLLIRMSRAGPLDAIGAPPEGRSYRNHVFPPSSWLLRREAAAAIGGFRDQRAIRLAVDEDYSRRAFELGQRIAFWPEASVVKFPSRLFALYAAHDRPPPQQSYLEELLRDPKALQHRLLAGLALNSASRRPVEDEGLGVLVRRIRRHLLLRLVATYGADRWPLDRVLLRHFQRRRDQLRKERGLPPA